jgi:hypothetical protein
MPRKAESQNINPDESKLSECKILEFQKLNFAPMAINSGAQMLWANRWEKNLPILLPESQ